MCLPLPSLFIYSWNNTIIRQSYTAEQLRLDHSTDSVNLPIINQSPSFDAASWNSSTNIVLSSILSHIYQHENELKHYFIKYKACIVHFLENAAHQKNGRILGSGTFNFLNKSRFCTTFFNSSYTNISTTKLTCFISDALMQKTLI